MKTFLAIGLSLFFGRGESAKAQLPPPSRPAFWTDDWQPRTTAPRSAYRRNADLLQCQLDAVSRQLNKLSVIDAQAYVHGQELLQTYMQEVNVTLPDYANETTFQAVRNRFIGLEDIIKKAMSEARRFEFEHPAVQPAMDTIIGKRVALYSYALLFARADYRSRIRETVPTQQTVTILAGRGPYYRVRYGNLTGYCGKRMVRHVVP